MIMQTIEYVVQRSWNIYLYNIIMFLQRHKCIMRYNAMTILCPSFTFVYCVKNRIHYYHRPVISLFWLFHTQCRG